MRLSLLAILLLSICLLVNVDAASKDRKKNKSKGRLEESSQSLAEDEDRSMKAGSSLSGSEERKKETKERTMSLAEKQQERRDEKKEESSEEDEKDKDEKKENATEIVIPRFRRQLTKAAELNDGQQMSLDKKPTQDHKCDGNCPHHQHRLRRHVSSVRVPRHDHELKKAQEINDGEKKELENAPSQTTQSRIRRHGNKHGHHKANHPHGSSKKNYDPYASESNSGYNPYDNSGRKPRAIDSSSEEKEKTEENNRKTATFTGHHGKLTPDQPASPVPSATSDVTEDEILSEDPVNKRVKKEVEAHPRSSEETAPKQDRDATLVSADAAEIMEIRH